MCSKIACVKSCVSQKSRVKVASHVAGDREEENKRYMFDLTGKLHDGFSLINEDVYRSGQEHSTYSGNGG